MCWNPCLKFTDKGKYVDVNSAYRIYFVAHVVLITTAYRTRPPDHGRMTDAKWNEIAQLLCDWISVMGGGLRSLVCVSSLHSAHIFV